MSDISTLSHEYEASAKLAEELNEAILSHQEGTTTSAAWVD